MIQSIDVTNYKSEALRLSLSNPYSTGLVITNVTGIGPQKASVGTTDYASTDGVLINSIRMTSRNIVISLKLLEDPTTKKVETTRLRTYKYFPIKKPLALTINTDKGSFYINGFVESNEPDIFQKEETVNISIICPDPWFYSEDSVVPIPKAGFEHNYDGTIETGVVFNIDINRAASRSLSQITIKNDSSDEEMVIDISSVGVGDDPYVETPVNSIGNHVFTKKKVFFVGKSATGNVYDTISNDITQIADLSLPSDSETPIDFSKVSMGSNSVCVIGNNIYFTYSMLGDDYRSVGGYYDGDVTYIYAYNINTRRLTKLIQSNSSGIPGFDHFVSSSIFSSLCADTSNKVLYYISTSCCRSTTITDGIGNNGDILRIYGFVLSGVGPISPGTIMSVSTINPSANIDLGSTIGKNHYPGMAVLRGYLYVFCTNLPGTDGQSTTKKTPCYSIYLNDASYKTVITLPSFGAYEYAGARVAAGQNCLYIVFSLYNETADEYSVQFYKYTPSNTDPWERLPDPPYVTEFITSDSVICKEQHSISYDSDTNTVYLSSITEEPTSDPSTYMKFFKYRDDTGWKAIPKKNYFVTGDQLEVSTVDNNRYVTLKRNNSEYNAIQALPKVSDWIHMVNGENHLSYTDDSLYGTDSIDVSMTVRNLYEGV